MIICHFESMLLFNMQTNVEIGPSYFDNGLHILATKLIENDI